MRLHGNSVLWLPPSLRPEQPRAVPQIWVPELPSRPRTDEEHAYYRGILHESEAIIERLRDLGRPKEEAAVEEDGRVSSGAEVDPVVDAAIVQAALLAPVPHRKQIGGTCGLYGIGMVMDSWHARDPRNPTAIVQATDLEPDAQGFKHYNFAPTTERRLLDVALERGWTAKGEMYHGKYTAMIAAEFGYQVGLHHNATLDDLYRVLDSKHPALVCYDNDRNGNPGRSNGHKAHYAVIEGYFDLDGERYLVAKHSWSRTTDRVWRARDFFESWSQMNTTTFYGTPEDGVCGPKYPDVAEPSGLDLPPAGPGLASIKDSLANVIFEIVPPDEPLVGGERFAPAA